MQQRSIADLTVSAIGLGGMPMSIEGRPDDGAARSPRSTPPSTPGVTLIDTADAYHLHADEVGHNEALIAEALALLRRRHLRRAGRHQGRPPAPRRRLVDARRLARAPREAVRGVAEAARRRRDRALPVPPPRPDGALRGVGRRPRASCSTRARSGWPASPTPTPAQIREASEILGGRLVSVQNQFSPAFRSSEAELRAVRRARHRVPAVEPARRHLQRRRASARARGVRRGRRRPRGQPAAGAPGLDAGPVTRRHPDPRLQPRPRRSATRPPRPTSRSPTTRSPAWTRQADARSHQGHRMPGGGRRAVPE